MQEKQIRSKKDTYLAFEHGKEYMHHYLNLIRALAVKTYEEIFGNSSLNGICLFSFGSPSRFEMLGESDLDLLIVKENNSAKINEFQRRFIEYLKPYKFCKLDIPDWGTINECEEYIKNAVTEANQVIESRYILGDQRLRKKINLLKEKYCYHEKFEKIIVFQYFYFNQYYKQRGRPGQTNLKYGHGGTRDFLFPMWLSSLRDGIKYIQESEEPAILNAIDSLNKNKDITSEDGEKYKKSVSFIAFLRNYLLKINKNDFDFGKTFINENTLEQVYERNKKLFGTKKELKELVEMHTHNIFELKQKVWTLLIEFFEKNKSEEWNANVKRALAADIDEKMIKNIHPKDEIMNTIVIWNINNKIEMFQSYFEMLSQTKSWIILTSMACHPNCPPNVLDKVAKNQGQKKGYEYILKVIGRNKNTPLETIKYIAENPMIEKSFKEPSITRLKYGIERANQL